VEVNGQLHAPPALLPGKQHAVPIIKEAGWASAGRYGQQKDRLVLPVIETRFLCLPARSLVNVCFANLFKVLA
jgi:hypothetical protein